MKFNENVEIKTICICSECKNARDGLIWIQCALDRHREERKLLELSQNVSNLSL